MISRLGQSTPKFVVTYVMIRWLSGQRSIDKYTRVFDLKEAPAMSMFLTELCSDRDLDVIDVKRLVIEHD